MGNQKVDSLWASENEKTLWMDEILHQPLYIQANSGLPLFQGGAGFRPSTVSPVKSIPFQTNKGKSAHVLKQMEVVFCALASGRKVAAPIV